MRSTRLLPITTIATAGALAACLAVAVPASARTTVATVHYTFRTLDNNRDTTFNQLLGINKGGVIAGYFGSGAPGHQNQGYTLSPPYGQASYRAENFPGAGQTQVTGISGKGVTVGFFSNSSGAFGANFGFYKKNGKYHKVVFPAASSSSPAMNQLLGINNSGLAVGFYRDASGDNHGYVYNIVTGKFTLIPLASFGAISLTATGINNRGDITGYFNASTGMVKAFLLTHAGVHRRIARAGAQMTQAFGVNNHDEVVGALTSFAGSTSGFTWTAAGGFQVVSDPKGAGSTFVNGVNDAGQLVGFYNSPNGNTHGMLATP